MFATCKCKCVNEKYKLIIVIPIIYLPISVEFDKPVMKNYNAYLEGYENIIGRY